MKRKLPKRHDLSPLLKFKRPVWSPKDRTVRWRADHRGPASVAKRRTPQAAFYYTDGAADGEVPLARARQAFADVQFNPSVLRDVSAIDTSREVLGQRVALPFGIAPTGFKGKRQCELRPSSAWEAQLERLLGRDNLLAARDRLG